MSLAFYMDVHVPRPVTEGLRRRGVSVLTAQEDRVARLPDPELLDRATLLGRILFSQDDDLLAEAARRQAAGIAFGGVVYVHQQRLAIGQIVSDLHLIAEICMPEDLANRVEYLPL